MWLWIIQHALSAQILTQTASNARVSTSVLRARTVSTFYLQPRTTKVQEHARPAVKVVWHVDSTLNIVCPAKTVTNSQSRDNVWSPSVCALLLLSTLSMTPSWMIYWPKFMEFWPISVASTPRNTLNWLLWLKDPLRLMASCTCPKAKQTKTLSSRKSENPWRVKQVWPHAV